jgi:radical SAM enzyme (TIGR01210 family)
MEELTNFCMELKKKFQPKMKSTIKSMNCWSEKDILGDEIVDTFVIIFRTKGCSWAMKSGCSMCGYFNDSYWTKISDEAILSQFENILERYSGEKFVKIFTSGSFLDDKEISPDLRTKILEKLYEKSEKISIESRPEYITQEKIDQLSKIFKSKLFEVSIGLETGNDFIREYTINKNFNFDDYVRASKIVRKNSCKLKTYLIVKPPFLTEKESMEDCIYSIEKIKDLTDMVSINPINVQRYTLVEYLWQRKQYRPSWLYTIIEILKKSKKNSKNLRLKCDIAGGGSIRGAHNCRNCDKEFLDLISIFSIKNDLSLFNDVSCNCYDKWQDQIDFENLGFGSLVDLGKSL